MEKIRSFEWELIEEILELSLSCLDQIHKTEQILDDCGIGIGIYQL